MICSKKEMKGKVWTQVWRCSRQNRISYHHLWEGFRGQVWKPASPNSQAKHRCLSVWSDGNSLFFAVMSDRALYAEELENLRKRDMFTDHYLQHEPEFALAEVSEQSCHRMEPMKPAVLCAGCSALGDRHDKQGTVPSPVSHHTGNHHIQNMDLKPVLSSASKNYLPSF